jgi:hypothetical protein
MFLITADDIGSPGHADAVCRRHQQLDQETKEILSLVAADSGSAKVLGTSLLLH